MKAHKVFVKHEQIFQISEQKSAKELLMHAKAMNPNVTHIMVHVGKKKKK